MHKILIKSRKGEQKGLGCPSGGREAREKNQKRDSLERISRK